MRRPGRGRPREAARMRLAGRLRVSWVAATGTGAAASLALAALLAVCAFVVVAVPRASLGYRTQVLQRMFRTASSSQTTVLADTNITGLSGIYLTEGDLAISQGQLLAGLRRDHIPLAPPGADWSGLTIGSSIFSVTGQPPPTTTAPPQMELLYRGSLAGNARLVAGTMPASAVRNGTPGTFQVAVTQATAARFGLHPGSRLQSAGQVLVVTGIIRPLDAGSSFWTVDPLATAPQLTYPTVNSAPYWDSAAFVGPAEIGPLQAVLGARPLHAVWSFPLALGGISADQAASLQQSLQAVSYLPAASAVSTSLTTKAGQSATIAISLSSGLVTALQPFVATDDAVQRVLSLLFVSLAVIAAMVALLGARLVAEHRRDELTMMRARGASLRQLALVALRGGAAAVLPAATAVAAAVAITPGPVPWLSWWLAALIMAAALGSLPLLAAWWQRTRRSRRGAAGVGAASTRRRIAVARRWTADVALAAAAAAGLILLRNQGLPPPGRIDLFTSAAPVLAAVPVALLIMRAYPAVLRWLTRVVRRRRGVVMVVGFARGSAAVRAGVLPAFALVLAFAVIAFAAMARGAVARGDVVASWQYAGADAVVTAPPAGPGITPAAQHLISRVAGVQRSAPISLTTGTTGQGQALPVVVVDPRQYAALVAATPEPAFPAASLARPPAGGPVPVLLSPSTSLTASGGLYAAGQQLRVRVAGRVAGITGTPPGSQFAVVPRWALGKQAPAVTILAITGPRLDTTALVRAVRHAVPGARTTLRVSLLAAISDSPLPHGGLVTFAEGIAAAAAFSLLILMLTLVLGARSREMTLARLTTMGLGPRQSRRITATETLPAILAAAVGGTACTLALVPLVGPAINLAAFTGIPVTVPLHADLLVIAATAAGLLFLAGLTLGVQDWLARGRGAAQALRAGE